MSEQPIDFSYYGTEFQCKIIQALLTDFTWSSQMAEVIKVDYFDKAYLKFLANKYFDYYAKYKSFPTISLLVSIMKDELKIGNDEVLREQIVAFLRKINTNPDLSDLPYVKEKSLDFCRKQAFKEALLKSVDLIKDNKLEEVMSLMKGALAAGQSSSVGHDFFEEMEARHTDITRDCTPTGIPQLDDEKILNGGIAPGELFVVIGAAGGGKSHFLTHIGCNAIKANKNVVHYTFELNWKYTSIRYDSNFTDIPSNEIVRRKNEVKEIYKNIPHGKLIVKEYPMRSCSVLTIRNHLEKLALKGFKPDLVIIDYLDIMRSTKQYNDQRFETKLIYEEVRGLSQELGFGVWSASQSNRSGAKNDVIDIDNLSEDFSKAFTSDFICSISRKSHEKANGLGRFYVAKNRFGIDGLIYPMKVDTAKSKFEFLSNVGEGTEDVMKQDEEAAKQALRKKWQEVKRDKGLNV